MFFHIFINRLKVLTRNRSLVFWTLVFPILLGTFFNMAFSNLTSEETFNIVDIAVVNDSNYKSNTNFSNIITGLSAKGDDQIFNTKYVNLDKAKKMLDDNDISGYIYVNDDINLVINSNGVEQTIIKSVVDSYKQNISTVTNIYSYNQQNTIDSIIADLNESVDYFKEKNADNNDPTVIYFYTLIGMACLYGGFWGTKTVNENEANLSKHGARLCVSPTHKFTALMAGLLAALIIQFGEVLILLAYLVFGLGVSFGNQLPYILLLTLFGCLAGVSVGCLVGVSNKKSENTKTAIMSTTSLLMAFLSGMMIIDLKILIQNDLPVLAYINPVNLITDGLYSLYYYDTYERFFTNIMFLGIFFIVISIICYMFMRRKKYDSI